MTKKDNKIQEENLTNQERIDLEKDLKHFGFLLPTNDEELLEFEKVYGTTQVALPEKFKTPDFIFEKMEQQNSVSPLRIIKSSLKDKESKSKKVISVKSTSKSVYFKKIVLAAEIANQLNAEPTFGRVKFVKILYLCEQVCKMDLATTYGKYAAGPLDSKLIYSIDGEFKKRKWFQVSKGEYGYKYQPLESLDEYKGYYTNYYRSEIESINYVIELLRKQKTDFCEIVATLFYVWKDLVDNNQLVINQSLIEGFYAWNPSKTRFEERVLNKTIDWMYENNIVPVY